MSNYTIIDVGGTFDLTQLEWEAYIETSDFQDFIEKPLTTGAVVSSATAMDAVAYSQLAMNVVADSQLAMDAVADSETAMDAVAYSQLAMNVVAASQLAMNAVAASQLAMNVVADSETARNAIGFEGLAYDTIAASSMAIGKYTIGYTTLNPGDYADIDAVADSQLAMNAVIDSETAMNVVADSETAMNAVAASETATTAIFESEIATEKIFGVSFPFDFIRGKATYGTGRIVLTRETRGNTEEYLFELSQEIDFTGINSLTIKASANTLGDHEDRFRARIKIGGSEVLTLDGEETTFEDRVIDVSGISGSKKLELGYTTSNFGDDRSYTVQYGRFMLS